ncbi:MAG TPA: hypothetical protein VJ801_13420 [Polyangia bacterium]|jgi:hypothetical protein|nr:hypothetical protein [Polyangia bacterium]
MAPPEVAPIIGQLAIGRKRCEPVLAPSPSAENFIDRAALR